MVRVKIQYSLSNNADKFVWRYPQSNKYSHLTDFITSTFSNVPESGFQIQYKDDEGDLITCSSETDIEDALQFAEDEQLKSLKLFVISNDDEDKHSNASALSMKIDKRMNEENENENEERSDENENEENEEELEEDERESECQSSSDEQGNEECDDEIHENAEEEEQNANNETEKEEEEFERISLKGLFTVCTLSECAYLRLNEYAAAQDNDESEDEHATNSQSNEENGDENENKNEDESDKSIEIGEILECLYEQMSQNKEAMNDFVTEICSKWPMNASYPIHFGALLLMLIESESKKDLYSFIIDDKNYGILQKALKQYSGSDIQGHIKQMANLCNTVGAEKFCCLAPNILKSFKSVFHGQEFELDFSPLLEHQKQSEKKEEATTKSEEQSTSTSNKKSKQKKQKKKRISSQSVNVSSKSKQQKAKKKRSYYSHGANISCSVCDACPIRGARFVCMVRENYNLCQECEEKLIGEEEQYPMIKIVKPRTNWHIKHFKGLTGLVAIPSMEESQQISGNASTIASIKEEESKPPTNAVTGVNDPSVHSKTFPFLSKEMQEKYMEAMKFKEEENKSVLPTDSVSQTHSQPIHAQKAPQSLDQLHQIPIASIMPSIPSMPAKAQNAENDAMSTSKKNQSFMDEIDELLKPSSTSKSTKGAPPKKTNNGGNNINNKELFGLIDLVNQGNVHRNVSINRSKIAMNPMNNDDNLVCDAKVERVNHPGNIRTNASATMKWHIRNCGNRPFGDRCKLAFVSGDGLLVSHYNIPNAKPTELVEVSMSFNAFSTPGTYETNFRLCSNGKQFGPQLIVKINVLPPSQMMMPRPPQQVQAQYQHNRNSANQAPPQQPPSRWGQQTPQRPPMNYYQQQQQQQQKHPMPPPKRNVQPRVQQQPQPQPQPQPPQSQTQTRPLPQPRSRPQIQPKAQPKPQIERMPEPKPAPMTKTVLPSKAYSGPHFEEPTSLFQDDDSDQSKDKSKEKKGWFGWSKKKEDVKKESTLKCLCGATLIYLDVKRAYKGKKVYCDICSKVCKQSIFHCPSGDIKAHPGGFDLCYQCGGSQVAKQPNPSPTELMLSTDKGHSSATSSREHAYGAYPALKPSAPPAPSPAKNKAAAADSSSSDNYDPNFVYPSQLKQLLDMGFEKEKARRLLLKNRGNMSQVLAQLIK